MASDFEWQQALRPTITKAVFHGILSFYPGEKISDTTMAEIAKEYLKKIGITETQFAIIKHVDKDHPHVHLIANLVNDEGKAIKDNWIGLKGKKVAQQLTIQYGLQQAVGKNPSLTHIEQLNERDRNRLIIYQTIANVLQNCRSLDDLTKQLQNRGIETQYKYKGQTDELQGISFSMGAFKYKGSEIDRHFSLKNLERTLQQQSPGQYMERRSPDLHASKSLHQFSDKRNGIEHQNAIDLILKAEKHPEHLPSHWKIAHEKKRKRRGLHL